MDKRQSNFFNMAKNVLTVLMANTIWRGVKLVEESFDSINGICTRISEAVTNQEIKRTAGYTESKDKVVEQLKDSAVVFANRIKVYAQKTDDAVLASHVNFTRASLNRKSLNRLIAIVRAVADSASGIVAKLEEYRITQSDIDALAKLADTAEELNAHRDAVRSEYIENTAHLAMLFNELRTECKLLDTRVDAFIDDEEFKRTYHIARRVYD